jgi:hypothetical protein
MKMVGSLNFEGLNYIFPFYFSDNLKKKFNMIFFPKMAF